jgi:hypothetical protein
MLRCETAKNSVGCNDGLRQKDVVELPQYVASTKTSRCQAHPHHDLCHVTPISFNNEPSFTLTLGSEANGNHPVSQTTNQMADVYGNCDR